MPTSLVAQSFLAAPPLPQAQPSRANARLTRVVFFCGLAVLFAAGCSHTRAAPLSGETPHPGERETGGISYYADTLAGNRMANGKPYQPNDATCAHRTYPFGTRLRVTIDTATSRCTVSDRGPFVRGRILDVSKAVARALGLIAKGVADGTIEVER
ncbi:MAG: septal ring lytic transglycosylase RlpA family lipoprotein [Clostridia bacterium]|nr:septal ring lytic transglycosylase RlpA family lipoprotein [Deltaproteobacteria bacterium]